MVNFNPDVGQGSIAVRYDRAAAASPLAPPSASAANLEAPAQAVTSSGEALASDTKRRDAGFARSRPENNAPGVEPSKENDEQAVGGADDGGPQSFSPRFDKTVTYDQEFGRTFTEIKSTSDDNALKEGVSIRIPSENLVKRLSEAVATMTHTSSTPADDDGVNLDV